MNVYLKTTIALVAVSTLTVAAAPPSYDAANSRVSAVPVSMTDNGHF